MTNPAPLSSASRNLITRLGRFFWLFIGLLAFILISPSLPDTDLGRWGDAVLLICILMAALFASRGSPLIILISLALNTSFLLCGTFFIVNHSAYLLGASLILLLFSLIYTTIFILFFVLDTSKSIGPDHIYGAICAYILIAIIFAIIYTMIALIIPNSFTGLGDIAFAKRHWSSLFYFSFTTLSTVGYGDITPVLPRARSFCILEQLTGTFYVAILIARLAGLYPPPERPPGPPKSA